MIIRDATPADMDVAIAMGEQFYATTEYAKFAAYDPATAAVIMDLLIREGVMLVAEVDGVVEGMVGLIVTGFMFNSSVKSAHEVMWWVNPEARSRGIGLPLLHAIEPACRERGAGLIQMMRLSTSPRLVDRMYERAGYQFSEASFTKTVN